MKYHVTGLFFLSLLSGLLCNVPLWAQIGANLKTPIEQSAYETQGAQMVVATQGLAATQAAKLILDQGGNLIDAAVAASFAISVERPQSTGLGGGGFMLYREAKSGKIYAIDFRERAPFKSHEKMFLDEKGDVIPRKSSNGIYAVATPGLVKGLIEIHQKFGKLPRAAVLSPAIDVAEKGFEVYPHLANALEETKDLLTKDPEAQKIFLKQDGSPYKVGEKLIQKDLATTLRSISKSGSKDFYFGRIAASMIRTSKKYGGLLTQKDLSRYRVRWLKPVRSMYRGYDVVSFPPPSSGGVHVIQILNMLEQDPLTSLGYGSVKSIHLMTQAMQAAFADRATYMGDPDFFKKIPLKGLLSQSYADQIRATFDLEKAKSSEQVRAGRPPGYESSETTHFSMMDRAGNVVVSTQTVNGWMGSGIVAEGTGVVLNNEMDDFSSKPGSSNIFGAIGGIPNSVAPGKTPLSSMAPTIVLEKGNPVLALGAPGGTKILTCVAQTILNYLDFKMSLYDSVAAVRFHHQWKPDQLDMEAPGPGDAVVSELKKMGHNVKLEGVPCRVNAVSKMGDKLFGAADPRDIGSVYSK